MSRGHGATQRRVLAVLAAHLAEHNPADDTPFGNSPPHYQSWLPVLTLGTTRADVESARRACKRLHAEGLVELWLHDDYGRPNRSARRTLLVRLSPDQETAEQWATTQTAPGGPWGHRGAMRDDGSYEWVPGIPAFRL